MSAAAAIAAAMAAMRNQRGNEVTLRRLVPGDDPIDVTVRVVAIGGDGMDDAPGGVRQNTQRYALSDDALTAASWPAPPRQGDKIITGGKAQTVQRCDTAAMDGVVLSYRISVVGF